MAILNIYFTDTIPAQINIRQRVKSADSARADVGYCASAAHAAGNGGRGGDTIGGGGFGLLSSRAHHAKIAGLQPSPGGTGGC